MTCSGDQQMVQKIRHKWTYFKKNKSIIGEGCRGMGLGVRNELSVQLYLNFPSLKICKAVNVYYKIS